MSRNEFLIAENALQRVASTVPVGSRLVITGATGWLGRTLVSLLAGSQVELFLLGSRNRNFEFGGVVLPINLFDLESIKEFEPTALFDFAFMTREHLQKLGLSEYIDINNSLIESALSIFSLPSVTHGLFTSSGAAVQPHFVEGQGVELNPYGYLKRKTELLVDQETKRLGKRSLVIRPWSLSGPLTEKSDSFAFSSFINQSRSGTILVRSNRPVVRRYTSVDDFLAISISKLFGRSLLDKPFDSGGELISALELAKLIASTCSAPVHVQHEVNHDLVSDNYFSDNTAWAFACKEFNYTPETLVEQIQRNLRAITEKV